VTVTAQLEDCLVRWLGAGLNDTVIGSVTRADLAVFLLYLLAAAVISLLAAAILRHRSRPGLPSESPNALNRNVLGALRKPLHVLIWIIGLYIAATPLLARLGPGQDVSAFEKMMDLLFKLGAATALFWFMFRATRIVEARLAKWTATTPSKLDDLLVPLLVLEPASQRCARERHPAANSGHFVGFITVAGSSLRHTRAIYRLRAKQSSGRPAALSGGGPRAHAPRARRATLIARLDGKDYI
jgi:hypothetical protein